MGLWSFVKDAGKSLFGGKAEAATPEAALQQEIADLGLEGDVKVEVQGEKVVITGEAPSQELREKLILAVGNVNGIATVEDAIVTPGADEPVFHTVVRGDTLSAIAKKTLGNANRYNEIFEANRPMLTHPDKIYPGQVLRIPKK